MSNDLLKQIDELVANKTFNLDALEGIKSIKDNFEKTLEECVALKRRNRELDDANGEKLERIDHLTDANKKLKEEIEKLNACMQKARESIYEAEKHKAVAEAFKFSLETVFKPATVRETMYQSIPISQNYNGNTTVMPYQQETKTTKEEL